MVVAGPPVVFPTVHLACHTTANGVFCYWPQHPGLRVLFGPDKVTVIRGRDATTFFRRG